MKKQHEKIEKTYWDNGNLQYEKYPNGIVIGYDKTGVLVFKDYKTIIDWFDNSGKMTRREYKDDKNILNDIFIDNDTFYRAYKDGSKYYFKYDTDSYSYLRYLNYYPLYKDNLYKLSTPSNLLSIEFLDGNKDIFDTRIVNTIVGFDTETIGNIFIKMYPDGKYTLFMYDKLDLYCLRGGVNIDKFYMRCFRIK